jgi:hypothetical protein
MPEENNFVDKMNCTQKSSVHLIVDLLMESTKKVHLRVPIDKTLLTTKIKMLIAMQEKSLKSTKEPSSKPIMLLHPMLLSTEKPLLILLELEIITRKLSLLLESLSILDH